MKDKTEQINWISVGGKSGDSQANKWDYVKDSIIIGTLKSKLENVGPNNSKLYEIENEGGVWSLWGYTALNLQMQAINVGDEIKIVYLGKVKNPNTGRTFNNFEVYRKG